MYFVRELFVKRGPLGFVWLAGTGGTKLTKKFILNSDVVKLCDDIMDPPGGAPLALPARAHLFLGVCRILGKKARYLLMDAVEAQSKVQLAICSSSVNLPCGRSVAKNDAISITMDFDDFASTLPPIPFNSIDIGEMDEDKLGVVRCTDSEVGLYYDHENMGEFVARAEDITLMEAARDEIVPMNHDPLLVDDSHGSCSETCRSLNLLTDSLAPQEQLPPIGDLDLENIQIEPEEQLIEIIDQSVVGSVAGSEAKASVSLLSRMGTKRQRPRRDVNTEVSTKEIQKSMQDTSGIIMSRPLKISRSRNLPALFHTELYRTMCPLLQEEIQTAQKKYSPFAEEEDNMPLQNMDEGVQDGLPSASYSVSGAEGERFSFGSIEQSRHQLPTFLEEEDDISVFLGQKIDVEEPVEKKDYRRHSRVSFQSEGSSRGSKGWEGSELGDIPPPDYPVSLSQFQIPEEVVDNASDMGSRFSRRDSIDRTTEILREVLHENFEEASAGPDREADDCEDHADILLDFDTVLQNATTEGAVRRRDAALSFLQLLVLKTMSMIDIIQEKPYGPIGIRQTEKFELSFSSSQFESM